MALLTIEMTGLQDELSRMMDTSPKVASNMVKAGAELLRDAMKSATPVKTGDLQESVFRTGVHKSNDTYYDNIRFKGYDRKGVANALKAMVLEYSSDVKKRRPFIRNTVDSSKQAVLDTMQEVFDENVKKGGSE